jgi:O-acetyl-ADP-ribose deacetylase (regulator of RNase III)
MKAQRYMKGRKDMSQTQATISYGTGNLFSATTRVITIPVNCEGVAGCGVARQARDRYPDWYEAYRKDCQRRRLSVGCLTLYQGTTPWLLNFPTKDTWRHPSRITFIEQGLAALVTLCIEQGIDSISFPRLGCGAGELRWEDSAEEIGVHTVMKHYLRRLPCRIVIYI